MVIIITVYIFHKCRKRPNEMSIIDQTIVHFVQTGKNTLVHKLFPKEKLILVKLSSERMVIKDVHKKKVTFFYKNI